MFSKKGNKFVFPKREMNLFPKREMNLFPQRRRENAAEAAQIGRCTELYWAELFH